jgi:hypothetical protein
LKTCYDGRCSTLLTADELKSGRLHENHSVSTWNPRTISAFAERQRETKKISPKRPVILNLNNTMNNGKGKAILVTGH